MNKKNERMKKILLILVMMSVGIASFAQETDYRSIKPPKGKSLVYIVRPSLFGLAPGFKVYANGQYLGQTFGKNYLYSVFEPGEQVITNTAENKDILVLKTEADKTYFVKQNMKTGLWTARAELTVLNEDEGRKALMKCGLSKSNVYVYNQVAAGNADNKPAAQPMQQESINNVQAEVRNDSLVVSFNLNTKQKVESVWVKIHTSDGKEITNNLLDKRVWDKGATDPNRKISWAFAKEGVDLAGQDILIDVKANVVIPEVAKVPVEKPKEVARYPLFRLGYEIMIDPNITEYQNNAASTLTFEYIAKPSWSILGGIGVQGSGVKYYDQGHSGNEDYLDSNDYLSVVIPITAEYKYNTGKWFRIYGGGGIQNRFVVYEDDEYLNIGQGLNRYVLGLKAEAGIEIKDFRLGAAYVSDITSYSVFKEKISYFGLTLGWRFGGSKAYIK